MSKARKFLETIQSIDNSVDEAGDLGYFYAYATDDDLNQQDARRKKEKEDELEGE